jgi:hypothetical protein
MGLSLGKASVPVKDIGILKERHKLRKSALPERWSIELS